MRRVVLVLPHLLSHPESDSVLREPPRGLAALMERARVFRLHGLPPHRVPEASWIGLDPARIDLEQGPLTVAALGADPPERSVHFHLSLLGVDDQGLVQPVPDASADEAARALEAARVLQTRDLTILPGERQDHGLVWENGSLDLGVSRPDEAYGFGVHQRLPQGDGELLLRRFIDDSVNLLDGLRLNRERADQGLAKLNLLWPWGPGIRTRVPNLALNRGEPANVASDSLRLQGLVRLCGDRHAPRALCTPPHDPDWSGLRELALSTRPCLFVGQGPAWLRRQQDLDGMARWLEHLDRALVRPLVARAEQEPFLLTLVAPAGHADLQPAPEDAAPVGLALRVASHGAPGNTKPFDERALDDPALPLVHAWELVQAGLSA